MKCGVDSDSMLGMHRICEKHSGVRKVKERAYIKVEQLGHAVPMSMSCDGEHREAPMI